jgi:hypothetical protein
LCFEDHYLVDDFNLDVFSEGIQYIKKDNIDKLYITGNDYSHQIKCHYKGNWFLSKDAPNVLTTTSLLPSVWKKNFFLKLLTTKKNFLSKLLNKNDIKTCHDFELVNNKYTLNCNTLMVKDYVVYPNLDCARKGKFNTDVFTSYRNHKTLGDKSWMKNTSDIDVFEKMYIKWKENHV